MTDMPAELVIHAPNVHTGGGLVLLKQVLESWPEGTPLRAFLDKRARGALSVPEGARIHWVEPSITGRLAAERLLARATTAQGRVLCFHGLPPLFASSDRVAVFLQNRLLIERGAPKGHPFKVRVRLALERLWCRARQSAVTHYIVQTPSMARLLNAWLRADRPVSIVPFHDVPGERQPPRRTTERAYDFCYVASGDAHKNHDTLIKAWQLLAKDGIQPALALTICPHQFPQLVASIEYACRCEGLPITNLGKLTTEQVTDLYHATSALIYPSTKESFGLPLIEAVSHGLPVLAPELDYVRDILAPAQTFDPCSPVSIARAVKRFLQQPEEPLEIVTARALLAEVFK